MLSKNPVKPSLIASTMFRRKPTGSRLMSAIAWIALLITLASRSDGKFISRRISVTTTSIDDDDELDQPRERLAEEGEDPHERADRIEQVVERQRVPDPEEDPGDQLERDAEPAPSRPRSAPPPTPMTPDSASWS